MFLTVLPFKQLLFKPNKLDLGLTLPVTTPRIEIFLDESFGQLAHCIFLAVSISGVGYSVTVQQVSNPVKHILYGNI